MAARQFFTQARRRRPQLPAQVIDLVDQPPRPLDVVLLTPEQIAERLAVPVKSVYDLVAKHGMPVRRIGTSLRFHPEEVNAWSVRRHAASVAAFPVGTPLQTVKGGAR